MAHYVILANFTDQGIKAIKETSKRAKMLKESAKNQGVNIKEIYWTLGTIDVVITLEAPNDEALAALSMKIGSLGNMKCQTLRAFDETEIDAILAK